MVDSSRWLPFKWKRRSAKQKSEASAGAGPEAPAAAPASQLAAMPSMQHLMQRMFDEPFFSDPFARFGNIERWFGDFSPSRFQPSADVVDEEGALRVTAELPGLEKKDIQLNVDGDVLTIRGEKKNEEESREQGVYRTERYYGYFQRSIPLPGDLDLARTEAEFKNGVLTVRLPRGAPKAATGTSIPIKS